MEIRMKNVPKLPKTHYYWTPSVNVSNKDMYELVRITGSYCVQGENNTEDRMVEALRLCGPLGATIGVNFSPWHRKMNGESPTYRGFRWFEEIDYFLKGALLIKERCGNIPVTAVMLDTECWNGNSKDPLYLEGMRQNLDLIHVMAKAIFPEAAIIWYGRGMVQHPVKDTITKRSNWTGEERTNVLAVSLYGLPEFDRMKAVYEATTKYDTEGYEIRTVIPYIALAAGYERHATGHTWRRDWDYDIKFSRMMGAYIQSSYTPYAIFYPPPFRNPAWKNHFIAYVEGATSGTIDKDLK